MSTVKKTVPKVEKKTDTTTTKKTTKPGSSASTSSAPKVPSCWPLEDDMIQLSQIEERIPNLTFLDVGGKVHYISIPGEKSQLGKWVKGFTIIQEDAVMFNGLKVLPPDPKLGIKEESILANVTISDKDFEMLSGPFTENIYQFLFKNPDLLGPADAKIVRNSTYEEAKKYKLESAFVPSWTRSVNEETGENYPASLKLKMDLSKTDKFPIINVFHESCAQAFYYFPQDPKDDDSDEKVAQHGKAVRHHIEKYKGNRNTFLTSLAQGNKKGHVSLRRVLYSFLGLTTMNGKVYTLFKLQDMYLKSPQFTQRAADVAPVSRFPVTAPVVPEQENNNEEGQTSNEGDDENGNNNKQSSESTVELPNEKKEASDEDEDDDDDEDD